MMKQALLFLHLYFFCALLSAQSFEKIDTTNSTIPTQDLNSIYCESDNVIWIGTGKMGLIKYENGVYTRITTSASGIKGSYISEIFQDSKNNLWVASYNPPGLNKFDGQKWETFSSKDIKLAGVSIYNIAEDKLGNIYVAGEYGASSYDGSNWQNITLPQMKYKRVDAIAISSKNELAIATKYGLYIRDSESWTLIEEGDSDLKSYVKTMQFIDDEKLIIGHGGNLNGGYSIYSEGEFRNFNKSNSNLSDNMVRDIEIDKNQTIWFATNDGLNYLSEQEIGAISFRVGKYMSAISDIAVTNNFIWIATSYGLYKIEI